MSTVFGRLKAGVEVVDFLSPVSSFQKVVKIENYFPKKIERRSVGLLSRKLAAVVAAAPFHP